MSEDLIIQAFEFAYRAHKNTKRKGSNIPYITHPMTVATILMRYNTPDVVVAASLLHDVVEDEKISVDEIRELFGDEVTFYVKSVTEPLTENSSREVRQKTWKSRKQHTINSLRTSTTNVKMLSCADKVANLSDIVRDLAILGEELWTRFNAPKTEQRWYYHSLKEAYKSESESIESTSLYIEFCTLVTRIFP